MSERLAGFERAEQSQTSLTSILLAGGGVAGLAVELARLTGLGIEIEDATSTLLARVPAPPTAPAEHVTYPVVAAGEELGVLRALGTNEPGQGASVLTQGSTIIALELQRQRGIAAAEARLHGELLEELLEIDGDPSEGLILRARRAGVELSESKRVAVMLLNEGADPEYVLQLARSVPSRPKGALLARRNQLVIATLAKETVKAAEDVVRSVQGRAARAGITGRVGISDSCTDLRVAFHEAMAALRLAENGDPSAIMTADRLGPLRFMLDAAGIQGMRAFVRHNLLALAEYDQDSTRSNLLGTLRAFVQADGRQRPAAEASNVHLNTLKYRLGRIEDITGRSTADSDVRFELRLAFGVLDVLEHLGCSALAPDG